MNILTVSMSVCHLCKVPLETRRGLQSLRDQTIRVIDSYESPHEDWRLNPGLWRITIAPNQGALIAPSPKLTFSEMHYFLYCSNLCIRVIMTLFFFSIRYCKAILLYIISIRMEQNVSKHWQVSRTT